MKNSKMKKFLVMMVAAVMTLGLLVPVSAAEEMKVSANETFENFEFVEGAGGWKNVNNNANVSGNNLSFTNMSATAETPYAYYWMGAETYGSDKIEISFDVQTTASSGTFVQIYSGTADTNYDTGGRQMFWLKWHDGGYLYLNAWSASTLTKVMAVDGTTNSFKLTFDMKNKQVGLAIKKGDETDYTEIETNMSFQSSFLAGDVMKKLIFSGPMSLDETGVYAIDNFKVSYQAPLNTSAYDDSELNIMAEQDFTSVTDGYATAGAWDIKNNNVLGGTQDNDGKVAPTNGKLSPISDSSVTMAQYWPETESYTAAEYVISFDVESTGRNSGKFFEFYTGGSDTEIGNLRDSSKYLCRLDLNEDGAITIKGSADKIAPTAIKNGKSVRLRLTFDMLNKKVTLAHKYAEENAWRSVTVTNDFNAYTGGDVLKLLNFCNPKMVDGGSFSIDNVVIAYKNSETKIEADLTVKDSDGSEVSDITDIAVGKMLTVTPKFTNVGSKDADSAAFIVAWYNKDGKLKKAVAKEVTTGLAANASYTDMEDITFTEATEAGDYIRAFAWNSLTALQPYKMAE